MMQVTEQAKSHLAAALDAAAADEERDQSCFRIVQGADNRLAMELDQQSDADTIVEHNGKPLLALDESVEQLLDGRTLDVQANDQGQPMLTLR